MIANYSKITLTGLNLENFINYIKEANIPLYSVQRPEYNVMTFVVNKKYMPFVREHIGKIELVEEDYFGLGRLAKTMLSRIGLVIGIILAITATIIVNKFTLHINVVGNETIPTATIITALNNYGIHLGTINHFNQDDLCEYLTNNVENISLVSVKQIGTSLIVNIKEKSAVLDKDIQAFRSNYNMQIVDYQIFAGVHNLHKGQLVKIGDILVMPENTVGQNGEAGEVAPKGTIDAIVWFAATYTMPKVETIAYRTGNKIISSYYMLNDYKFLENAVTNTFELFEEESMDIIISNYLIPLRLHKTIYYEMASKTIENDFSNLKDKIIANLHDIVYNNVTSNLSVQDDRVDVIETSDSVIVNYYLQCSTVINIE